MRSGSLPAAGTFAKALLAPDAPALERLVLFLAAALHALLRARHARLPRETGSVAHASLRARFPRAIRDVVRSRCPSGARCSRVPSPPDGAASPHCRMEPHPSGAGWSRVPPPPDGAASLRRLTEPHPSGAGWSRVAPPPDGAASLRRLTEPHPPAA